MKKVDFGKNLTISSLPLFVKHPNAVIKIGDDVIINNKSLENPAGIHHRCVISATMPGARLQIGNNVGLSGVVLFCSNEIIIDDYVNLGVGVRVYDTDFHPLNAEDRRIHDVSRIKTAPVKICKDVWVGANAIILKGVTIGERSIIGAGSVVTKDIPPDSFAAGVPAKLLKKINL